jgi:regulator of RNase E activity RraA
MDANAMTDDAIFETIRTRLFTAVIGDILDVAGHTHQFLPPEIRGLTPGTVMVGRAMPVLEADCVGETVASSGSVQPFGLMLRALDELQANEIYITTGASPRYALWGGLMSTRARALGAAGAVLDGFHRDTHEIVALEFPVFSRGSYAQDQRLRGRVIDYRCTIEFGNAVRVAAGDVIVGDIDGVVVIPAAHLEDVVAAAVAKVDGEERVRGMIQSGTSTEAIWAKIGIM